MVDKGGGQLPLQLLQYAQHIARGPMLHIFAIAQAHDIDGVYPEGPAGGLYAHKGTAVGGEKGFSGYHQVALGYLLIYLYPQAGEGLAIGIHDNLHQSIRAGRYTGGGRTINKRRIDYFVKGLHIAGFYKCLVETGHNGLILLQLLLIIHLVFLYMVSRTSA